MEIEPIQRWAFSPLTFHIDGKESRVVPLDEGAYVLYADHLSRLAASEERCERLRRLAWAYENLPYEMEGAGETMMRKSSEAQLELSEAREACTEAGDLAPRRPGKRGEGI